jgi:glycosyltransferase involved in cell wall biosynthesis
VASARLGVVPLRHASGIQNKVLEAAALGLPQLVDTAAVAGLRPGFPAVPVGDDDELVRQVVDLLEDDRRLTELGRSAREHVRDHYTAEAYVPWARSWLAPVS